MKSRVLWVLLVFFGFWSSPAVANNRFIVRTPSGLASLQQVCLVLGCNVVPGGLDGSLSKLFLVTTPDCLVATLGCIDPNVFLQLLRSQPGIQHVELDALLKVMQGTATAPPPSALSDNTPVNYFGANVIHGYVNQPAITIIHLPDAQAAFSVRGAGIVAVICKGVDPGHPGLQAFLVHGYDFTPNAGSASMLTDVHLSPTSTGASPAMVNQSSAAILDPASAFNLYQQPQYQAFGHGTMVSGIIHLVAPTAQIMPLKAFNVDGSGYLSDILRASYFAVQNGARVVNMSFSFITYSYEMATALKFANRHRVISVDWAGNDGAEVFVYT